MSKRIAAANSVSGNLSQFDAILDAVPKVPPMLAEFDAETRFRLRVAQGAGKTERGLDLLNKLDAHFMSEDRK